MMEKAETEDFKKEGNKDLDMGKKKKRRRSSRWTW